MENEDQKCNQDICDGLGWAVILLVAVGDTKRELVPKCHLNLLQSSLSSIVAKGYSIRDQVVRCDCERHKVLKLASNVNPENASVFDIPDYEGKLDLPLFYKDIIKRSHQFKYDETAGRYDIQMMCNYHEFLNKMEEK